MESVDEILLEDNYLDAKREAFELINKARSSLGLPLLQYEAKLSLLASMHCREMATKGYLSHWDTQGRKPFLRYFQGGFAHHIDENIYGLDRPDGQAPWNSNDAETQQKMLTDAIHQFLSQNAPADLEKQHLLHPDHTHVAVGAWITEDRFRMVVVYANIYVELSSFVPKELTTHEFMLEGKCKVPNYGPYGVLVYYSKFVDEFSTNELNNRFGGSEYDDQYDSQLNMVWPWDMEYHEEKSGVGVFTIPVQFKTLEPGFYYLKLYMKDSPKEIPYAEYSGGVQLPGEGSICATGIVLMVPLPSSPGGSIYSENMRDRMETSGNHSMGSLQELIGEVGTLEERQAIETALNLAIQPDPELLVDAKLVVEAGFVTPEDGWEQKVFMPSDRQTHLTMMNMGCMIKRLDESHQEETIPEVIVDIRAVGDPEKQDYQDGGYEIFPVDISKAKSSESASAARIWFCIKREPLGGAEVPLVDVAMVYGTGTFDMGGGFVTYPMPEITRHIFGMDLFLCTKKMGAGREAAEILGKHRAQMAERAVMHEKEAMSLGGEEDSEDDMSAMEEDQTLMVDKDMTPSEIQEWEMQRAEDMGTREVKRQQRELMRRQQEATEALKRRLAEAKEEKARALKEYNELQRKVAALLARQKRSRGGAQDGPAKVDKEATPQHESEKLYADTLAAIMEARDKLVRQQGEYDKIALDLQSRLDDKESKAHEITTQFREFKREIAQNAENSRTCKPIPKKIIDQFEKTEQSKDEETEKVRLKNINLRMALKKLEGRLRAKEQLAEGLHLIDFEQLRIENQSQNEKIEERNEELHKLRRKNQKTVEVLTHMKEKLKFVEAENSVLKDNLEDLDAQLSFERDRLSKAKKERDSLRGENHAMKQRQGFTNSDLLVVDFEQRKLDIKQLQDKIAELKERHHLLVAQAQREKARLKQTKMTSDDMAMM